MKKADIIVLSGQSNAVGVGHISCLPSHFDNETIAIDNNPLWEKKSYRNIRYLK